MAHTQKPDFVFRRNGRVYLIRRGRQFNRLLESEVCASAVVMLDTPCSEVVWRLLATYSIRQFPLHFPSRSSPCAITFQLDSTSFHEGPRKPRGTPSKDSHCPCKRLNMPFLDDKHKNQRWIYVESQCELHRAHRKLLRVKKGSQYEHLSIIIVDFSLLLLGRPKRISQILCPGNQNEVPRPHFFSPYLLQGQWRRTNRSEGSADNNTSSFRPYRGSP